MSEITPQTDTIQLKNLNEWLGVLVVFIILWSIGLLLYVDQKVDSTANHPLPVIVVDGPSGRINNAAYTNLFPPSMNVKAGTIETRPPRVVNSTKTNVVTAPKPMFETRDSYEIREFVIVNYFYVEGIVTEKKGDDYTVMYKDHNHVLQKVTVPKSFLLVPTSYNNVNPVSLLVD